MTHRDPTSSLDRLEDEPGRAGDLIRFARSTRSAANVEAAAWNRLERHWARPRWPLRATLLTAGAVAICLVLAQRTPPSRSNHSTAKHHAPAASADAQPSLVTIPTGWSTLADGSKIQLSATGKAETRTLRTGHTQIKLAKGSVELSVTPKQKSELLEVEAGGIVFRVVGTEFQVSLRESGPHLDVRQGRVAVYEHGSQLALVGAGGSWDSTPPVPSATPEPFPVDVHTRKETLSKPEQDCLALARQGSHRQALDCFDRQSRGGGLDAEVALYESARLRRDVLSDFSGALSTLREYERRFPQGSFSTEASVTVVELHAALGNSAAALQESARLLASGKARERAPEIRMLRGRLLQRQGEYAQAVPEYSDVIAQGGSLAPQARMERAKCLNASGRRHEAIAEYREILSRTTGRNADLAKKQLEALTSDSTTEQAHDQ